MKKFRISMIVLILAGVLAGGIGTGISLVELSDMKYNGTVWYGMEHMTETKMIYEIDDRDVDQIYCYTGMAEQEDPEVIEDRKVPVDEIWFEIRYNPEYGEPMMDGYGAYDSGEYATEKILREDVHIWMNRKGNDEFEMFMKLKDQILEEWKDHKLSSYRLASVSGIKVYVHPLNVDKLTLM